MTSDAWYAQPIEDENHITYFARRCRAYLDDAPSDGGHSDAAGSSAYELIQEAIDILSSLPPSDRGSR